MNNSSKLQKIISLKTIFIFSFFIIIIIFYCFYLNSKNKELSSEVYYLERRISDVQDDNKKLKSEIDEVKSNIENLTKEIKNETINRQLSEYNKISSSFH